MNLTGNKTELKRVSAYVTESDARNTVWFYLLVGISFLVHGFVAYSQRPFATGTGLELFFGAFNFVAIVFLFYGVSRLYYNGQLKTLAVIASISIVMTIAMSVKVSILMITAGWCAVLLTPIVCAHLTTLRFSAVRVFGFSVLVLALFSSIQLFPLWTKMIFGADEALRLVSGEMQQMLAGAGYAPDVVASMMEQFRLFYESFIRIIPSITIMALMFQFTLGYLMFMRWLNKSGHVEFEIASFLKWKMPFELTPVLLAAVIARLTGNELMTLVADNLILILAVLYSISGIAIMEFFMKKFYVSTIGRILIYLLLFLSHLIGFALLAVLGFVDSFYDWRRKYPLPMDIKTS